MPVCVRARSALSPGSEQCSMTSSSANARSSSPGSVAVATMSRSLTASTIRRAEPASSTRSEAGCARSAATMPSPISSALVSSTRGRGASPTPAANAASTDSSNFAPKPRTPRRRCSSAAARSAGSESMPSSSNSRRARLGPRPGRRVMSTSPGGNRARSFSTAGIVPVSTSARIFSSSVLPIPASDVTVPARASAATEVGASRTALAALR